MVKQGARKGDSEFVRFVFYRIEFLEHFIDPVDLAAAKTDGQKFVQFPNDPGRVFNGIQASRGQLDQRIKSLEKYVRSKKSED